MGGYTETDTTGMLSPPTVWRQQSEFVSRRQSGQILAAVGIGFECRCNGQNGCRFKCSHTFLHCIPRQMLVVLCCVGSGSNVAIPLDRAATGTGALLATVKILKYGIEKCRMPRNIVSLLFSFPGRKVA